MREVWCGGIVRDSDDHFIAPVARNRMDCFEGRLSVQPEPHFAERIPERIGRFAAGELHRVGREFAPDAVGAP
jgi:hypothetical protein